ncbi:MAG: AAA family ATPase, partial [Acidimicrobiia bacterium]|nr:AAA family ATPase [Acidimicrobiia bacterium]
MPGPHPTPLVGRARELDVLEVALDSASRGFGGLVALTGEAGIGKTRLAEEVVARACELGFVPAWGSGWPEGGSPPLWPWQDILEQLGDAEAVRVLDGHAERDALDPERFARFRRIGQAVAKAASERPLIIVVDDAQATDRGALLLARFLARSLHRAKVLLLVTYRIDLGSAADAPEVVDALVDLTADGTRLELRGLDEADVAEVVSRSGRPPAASDLAALRQLTGGNPLLVHEALAAGVLDHSPVPSRVRRLLLSRLAPFGEAERSILVTVAVLGATGDENLVAAVSGASVASVRAVCERARSAGLLRPDPVSGHEGFAHGLLRDALVEQEDAPVLTAMHRRAADELAALPSASTPEAVTRIAHHRALAAA